MASVDSNDFFPLRQRLLDQLGTPVSSLVTSNPTQIVMKWRDNNSLEVRYIFLTQNGQSEPSHITATVKDWKLQELRDQYEMSQPFNHYTSIQTKSFF